MTTQSEKPKPLLTPVSILSYPSLDEARKSEDSDGPPKFGAAFVFTVDKLSGAEYKALQAAVMGAAQKKFPGESVTELTRLFKLPVEDGGLRSPFRRNWEAKKYPEGSVYINARSTNRPICVLADMSIVPLEKVKSTFYAGALVKASLGVYFYEKKGNRGVSLGLNNVQFIRDGERLDNRLRPEQEFTADMSEAPESLDDVL